jgi:hypothetical protein
MSEPVERRLSPERLSRLRYQFDRSSSRAATIEVLNALEAAYDTIDALRAERESDAAKLATIEVERTQYLEGWRQADEATSRASEGAELRAERDAAAPILEAAKAIAYAFEGQDVVERAHGRDFARLSPSADLLIERVAALVAALFPDDLPAPEEKP